MADWPLRRWLVAAGTALVTVVGIGVPTALIPTPLFGRGVPAPGWAWPVLVVTAVLSGLVTATYVVSPEGSGPDSTGTGGTGGTAGTAGTTRRGGMIGGFLAYLAVGCPTCNKVALLALGSTGAVRWFAPVQPILAVAGIAALGYALRRRLAGERACPLPAGRR